MRKDMIVKALVLGVICLFIGVGVQPAFAVDIPETEEVEPKDYLFETIIEIANNPDVKDLFEEFENCINFDFNGKYIFRQLFFKNPELLCTIIFSKPEITTQYLDKTYNQGIELIAIFGEEKAYEILDSVEITNPNLLDDLNNIILNNEEIFNRVSTLAELNEDNSTICDIIFIFGIMGVVKMLIFGWGVYWLEDFPSLHDYFLTRLNLLEVRFAITAILLFHFNCIEPW
jgi:hypothetical protein